MQNSKVYINKITDSNLQSEIKKGLDFIDYSTIINDKSVIFIKPNLTDVFHRPGITTTPKMIKAVLEVLSPLVKKIYIGESDGGNYSYSADAALENHKINEFAISFPNVDAVNLSKLSRTRIEEIILGKKVWVDLPDLLLNEIDCLVSLPVLKAHAMTHGSFSIKNLWGCYPDPMRLLYHKNLDYKLALINKILKNKIQIIDGFWALDGHGPIEGTAIETNRILISNDPVAVDTTAAYIMNLDMNKIKHLGICEKFELGISDLNKLDYNKDITKERLSKFKPYKVNLDHLSELLFNSEILSKLVLSSPITPVIYNLINITRSKEKRTFWAEYNLKNSYISKK